MNNVLIPVLKKEQFLKFLAGLKNMPNTNFDLLYKIYLAANEGIKDLVESGVFVNGININPFEIVSYCAGEYIFTIEKKNLEEINSLINDENYINGVASIAADKYISLSVFRHNETKLINKFLPPVSSLNLYLNFMLNIVNQFKKNDPKLTLISDLFFKSISYARCILSLVNRGYETEAFATWRTLHECECTLLILNQYGNDIIEAYLKHMQYGIVFEKCDKNDEKGNKLFAQMKKEMNDLSLKSKDIKKYIEYGWLYAIKEVKDNPNFKLNFRDGIQPLVHLENYSDRYELSSEIIHSTPLLIYSNKEYFYHITLLSLYESFFRLEPIFEKILLKHLSRENASHYKTFYNVYFSQLVSVYKREVESFENWKNKK